MSSRSNVLVVPNSHCERLGDFGLARSRRSGEEEDADRPCRVGHAGLHHGDPLDQAVHGFLLAEHLLRQPGFQSVQVEVPAVVENLQGKAGLAGEGDHHIVQSQLRLGVVGPGLQPVQGRLQQAEQVARRRPVAQVLLRQVPGVIQQLRAFRLRGAVQPLLRQVERRLRGKRLHAQGREGRDRPRLQLQQLFQGGRAGLADDPEGPLLDQGQDDIQGADGAVTVTARERQSVKRGYEPDGPPVAAQLSDDGVQLLLELPDIDLAGDQVGVAADEDDPALVVEPPGEPSQECGLADAALADHETGLRAIGEQRRLEPVDPSLERRMLDDGLRRLGVLVVPDAADRSQQPPVDVPLAPTVEAFEKPVADLRLEVFQEPAEVSQRVLVQLDGRVFERRLLAGLEAVLDELRQERPRQPIAQITRGLGQDPSDDRGVRRRHPYQVPEPEVLGPGPNRPDTAGNGAVGPLAIGPAGQGLDREQGNDHVVAGHVVDEGVDRDVRLAEQTNPLVEIGVVVPQVFRVGGGLVEIRQAGDCLVNVGGRGRGSPAGRRHVGAARSIFSLGFAAPQRLADEVQQDHGDQDGDAQWFHGLPLRGPRCRRFMTAGPEFNK